MLEHEVTACQETDKLIYELLGKVGEAPPYSTDRATAQVLAKEIGLGVLPVHEPNHSHFFDAWGILPEEPPIGFLGFLEVEPDETSENLLLQHGWRSLTEADTLPLAVCRSLLLLEEAVQSSRFVTCSERAQA